MLEAVVSATAVMARMSGVLVGSAPAMIPPRYVPARASRMVSGRMVIKSAVIFWVVVAICVFPRKFVLFVLLVFWYYILSIISLIFYLLRLLFLKLL